MRSPGETIADVKEKLLQAGLAGKHDFSGCSESEIAQLEEFYKLTLPAAYREFLRVMGKGAGRFMQGTDVLYQSLFKNRAAMEEVLAFDGNPFVLPASSFVFSSHQGYIFHYLDTAEGVEDPDVIGYCEGDLITKRVSESFTEFLLTSVENEQTAYSKLSPWAKSL